MSVILGFHYSSPTSCTTYTFIDIRHAKPVGLYCIWCIGQYTIHRRQLASELFDSLFQIHILYNFSRPKPYVKNIVILSESGSQNIPHQPTEPADRPDARRLSHDDRRHRSTVVESRRLVSLVSSWFLYGCSEVCVWIAHCWTEWSGLVRHSWLEVQGCKRSVVSPNYWEAVTCLLVAVLIILEQFDFSMHCIVLYV